MDCKSMREKKKNPVPFKYVRAHYYLVSDVIENENEKPNEVLLLYPEIN